MASGDDLDGSMSSDAAAEDEELGDGAGSDLDAQPSDADQADAGDSGTEASDSGDAAAEDGALGDGAGSDLDAQPSDAELADTGDSDAAVEPPRKQFYVNADTGSDTNAGTSDAPLKTLTHAFQEVGEHGLVWLQPSTFTSANEGLQGTGIYTGVTAPLDTRVRATGPGVTMSITLQFPKGGSLEDVTLETVGVGRVLAGGGNLLLRGVSWVRSTASAGVQTGLELTGQARVTLEPGADPNHDYFGAGEGVIPALASLQGTSELAILGGVIDGASGAGFGYLIDVRGDAKLTLRGVTISNNNSTFVSGGAAVYMGSVTNHVLIEDSSIDLNNNSGGAACVLQDDQEFDSSPTTGTLTIRRSKLTRCTGGSLQLREGDPVVQIEDSELSGSGSRCGIETGQIGFDSGQVYGKPRLTISNTTLSGNYMCGVAMNSGGSLTMQGGSVTNNGQVGFPFHGGVLLNGAFPYTLSMRGVSIVNNRTNGVSLVGDTSASFDLGTLASQGNNTLTGNSTYQVRLGTAANTLVQAIGNQWASDTQGADAGGRYTVSGAHCANANPCEVKTGTGPNYAFVNAGAEARLHLAAQ